MPDARAAAQETPFENPPTTKKIGMTWTIHVSTWVLDETARTWVASSPPSAFTKGAAALQWPPITSVIDTARRKST